MGEAFKSKREEEGNWRERETNRVDRIVRLKKKRREWVELSLSGLQGVLMKERRG